MAPTRETFADSDRGSKSITWTPVSPGTARIAVDDTTGRTGVSNPIVCLPETPAETIYWGDTHCFSKISGGLRSPAETLKFARDVAFLDFCAVSDSANLMSDRQWDQASRDSIRANADGEFVSLLGYQWSDAPNAAAGRQVGARTILTSGNSLALQKGGRAGATLRDGLEKIGQSPEDTVVFASHPILDASWEQHDETRETAVEIYSTSVALSGAGRLTGVTWRARGFPWTKYWQPVHRSPSLDAAPDTRARPGCRQTSTIFVRCMLGGPSKMA